MTNSTKRCLIASCGAHGLLALALLFGSAFRPTPTPPPSPTTRLTMIPSFIVENALAGGGGNPKIAPSEDKQKGDTLNPLPPPTLPPETKVAKDEPKKEVEKPPVKVPVKEPIKDPVKDPVKDPIKAPDVTKKAEPNTDVAPKPKISLADLKPRKEQTKKEDAEARKNAEAEAQRQADKAYQKRVADAAQALRSGFSQGTAVEVSGTGGAAYADYASIVKAIYDDAWIVTDNVPDDNSTATVRVKIARDGDVIEATLIRRSGNPALDHTVESTLRKVKYVRPFPAGTRDQQRTFTINFNLKGKRTIG